MSTAPPAHPEERSSRNWLLAFFAAVAAVVLLHSLLAWRLDVYGIWRDPHGRALATSNHERKAKYLLNGGYVPANFDGLVVGGSSSINWQLGELGSYHFYNESLEGGNGTEERLLAEHALEHGHFKAAVIGLHPHVTGSHDLQDGLDEVNRAETLGSLSAFDLEWNHLREHFHHGSGKYYPNGGHDMPAAAPPPMDQSGSFPMDFRLDATATADYVALVRDMESRHIRLVYVVYPILGPYFHRNQAGMTAYVQHMQSILPPAPLIDFNTPQYTAFTDDPTNFIDQVHLSAKGTQALTPLLRTRLAQAFTSQPPTQN